MQSDELWLHHDHGVKIPRKDPEKLIKLNENSKSAKSFLCFFYGE